METLAVILAEPKDIEVKRLALSDPGQSDIVVDVAFSGISTGTEKLLWTGAMPDFPGMGYPLVPGYETVGQIAWRGADVGIGSDIGDWVFLPGAQCFGPVKSLFGGAAQRLVVPAARAVAVANEAPEEATLLALAATAAHALRRDALPDLIVGHGVLGRLLARLTIALGGQAPTVWEMNSVRQNGATGYNVIHPGDNLRRDYHVICDASGDAGLLDQLIQCLAPGGEIILAGFYSARLGFAFAPAFMREARFRIAAQWQPEDLSVVQTLLAEGKLSFADLITHKMPASEAPEAYRTAFHDPSCLKLLLDWRDA